MNVSVVDVSANQKKVQIEIPASAVQKELEAKYRELAKSVKIKGFRPGKAPRSILKSYYGKSVEHEVSSDLIQKSFPEALKETGLKPLTPADVSESRFEENGALTYTALVETSPPFDLPSYKGLKVYKPPVEVPEDRVEEELARLREQHAELRTVEQERPVAEGDIVIVDFTPSVAGKVFEKGKNSGVMIEVGKKSVHPDFDAKLVGRLPGETFSFELDYPEDAPTREIAGKRVTFELTIKELKEKELPELDDDFAKSVGSQFETLEALKNEIRERLIKREEEKLGDQVRQQIADKLLDQVQIELPPKVVESEVDRMIGMLRYQFESQGLQFDASKFNTPEIRAGYRAPAERNVRRHLIFDKIAEAEGIALDEAEKESIYQDIAKVYRTDVSEVRREFAESPIVQDAEDRKIQDKVFGLLEQEAEYTDAPEPPAAEPAGSEAPKQE